MKQTERKNPLNNFLKNNFENSSLLLTSFLIFFIIPWIPVFSVHTLNTGIFHFFYCLQFSKTRSVLFFVLLILILRWNKIWFFSHLWEEWIIFVSGKVLHWYFSVWRFLTAFVYYSKHCWGEYDTCTRDCSVDDESLFWFRMETGRQLRCWSCWRIFIGDILVLKTWLCGAENL